MEYKYCISFQDLRGHALGVTGELKKKKKKKRITALVTEWHFNFCSGCFKDWFQRDEEAFNFPSALENRLARSR